MYMYVQYIVDVMCFIMVCVGKGKNKKRKRGWKISIKKGGCVCMIGTGIDVGIGRDIGIGIGRDIMQ